MDRGLAIEFQVRRGMPNENFVAEAIGNLAAFRLQQARGERLTWQVVRVGVAGSHHFRLVVRHPDRALDIGIGHELKGLLEGLSRESSDELRQKLDDAERTGLHRVPLRHVHEGVDFWNDDFWNWIG